MIHFLFSLFISVSLWNKYQRQKDRRLNFLSVLFKVFRARGCPVVYWVCFSNFSSCSDKTSSSFLAFSPLAPSSESTLIGPRMAMISLRFSQRTLRLWIYCKVVHFILNQSHCANLN